MKRSPLALAILVTYASLATAQTSVSIYGVADAGIVYRDSGAAANAKSWRLDSGQHSGSRIGFRGTEDLGGGMSASFVLENGYSIDDGTQGQGGRLFGRQAFVGLNGGFGSVKFGRQYNPIRTALESVDPFGFGLAGNISNVFNAYGERADNTVNYSMPNRGGFSGQAAYSFGEIADSVSTGRQFGLSLGYQNGPLNVVLARHDQNLVTGTPATTANGDANTTMLGGTYDFGLLIAHAAYAINKGESAASVSTVDSRDMMLGLSAPVGKGTILASYIRKDERFRADRDATQLALGYTHSLSKRTNLYTSYARVRNDAAATTGAAAAGNDPSVFNAGIRHKF